MGMKIFTVLFFSQLLSLLVLFCNAQSNTTFQVGVILDVDSLVGRVGLTSLSLAASDFYSENSNYSTRIALHIRDSRRRVTGAAASALNLLKDVRVDAIIGPQQSAQANFVIDLGDSAKVPVISFSATSPSLQYHQTPYFVQTALNDADQVDAIAAIVKYFRWYQVVLVHEDSDYGNGIIPYLSNALKEVNAEVSYRSVIPVSATDDFILKELYMMKTMQTRVFVVHLSSSLASNLFLKAKEAKMMSKGYAWIVTTGLMDLFYSFNSNIVESMDGVLGVKPLFPTSTRLRSTEEKWKEKFLRDNPGITRAEMSLYGLWAYDTLWALAMAAEKVGSRGIISSLQNTSALNSTDMFVTEISQTGPELLEAMLGTSFQGLAGDFRLVDGQRELSSFQILNVVGNKTREVGIWTKSTRSLSVRNENVPSENLTGITWPGETMRVPKGWEFPVTGKILRIGVPEKAGFPEFVKVERDPRTNSIKRVSGYIIELFEAVMNELPYPIRYEYHPFETTSQGGYDNLTSQVFQGVYDAAVGDITITADRLKYVEFTVPIEEGGITRIQKIKHKSVNENSFFLEPFTKELWLTAIVLLIFTGVALWILEHRFNTDFRGPPSEHVGLILYIPFMSLVFANRERIVSNSARLVIVVWTFVVLILSSTYTASLSARLTAPKLQHDNTTAYDLIRKGDKVGCRDVSFIFNYLIDLGFDKSKITRFMDSKDVDFALSEESGKDGIKAFFSRTPYTDLFLSNHCKYMKVGSSNSTMGFAFVFPKGSSLVADVSRAIIKLTDNQIKTEIKGRYIRRDSECNEDKLRASIAKKPTIRLKSFKILFGITGGITATCLVVFLVSYLHQNRDFIQRIISNSSLTTWSKTRAISKHFDQRDPKSFRFNDDDEDASPTVYASSHHRNTVVPISSEEMPSDNAAVGRNTD